MERVTKKLADKFAQTFFGYFIKKVKFNNVKYFEDYPQHTIQYTLGRAQLCIFQTYDDADAPNNICKFPTPIGYLEINAQFVTYLTLRENGEVLPIPENTLNKLLRGDN